MSATGAGQLDQRITLQQPTGARDGFGQETITWQAVAIVWASAQPLRGREYFAAAAVQREATVRFTIRHRADVLSTWRILWASKVYQIDSPPVMKGRKQWLEILASERPNDGNS